MTVEVDFWQLVLLLVAFFGGCAGLFKFIMGQQQNHLDASFEQVGQRLNSIEAANKKEADQWQRVERELLELKADLPDRYVRREDYIIGQSIIMNKLDSLAVKIENVQLRGLQAQKGEKDVY